MTQREKELLLRDLCARLPHHIYVLVDYVDECNVDEILNVNHIIGLRYYTGDDGLINIKPYLRPMSSMTEEEKKELRNIGPYLIDKDDNIIGVQCNSFIQTSECQDWLNEHYFDYRNLIQMGLALEAPKNMYKIWQQ